MKYTHSTKFYKKKYAEIKKWADEKNKKIREKNEKIRKINEKGQKTRPFEPYIDLPWKSMEGFITTYDDYIKKGSNNPTQKMKYNLQQYNTDYETVIAERRFLKAANLDMVSLKDLKKMSTADFYEKYEKEISEFRNELRGSGLNSYQANKIIAMHFFGSN